MLYRFVRLSAATALFAFCGVLTWFRLNEDDLIFAPDQDPVAEPSPELYLDSQDVWLRNSDGLRLKARVIPPPASIPTDEAAWLLYCHGSSGSIGIAGYNEAWANFRRAGLGVVAVDYRGFGDSEGEISEQGIYQDAETAYRYLTDTLSIPPRRILLYGFSLGAAVAIELATRVPAAGLLVEGGWISLPQIAAERYPFLPLAFIAKNRFESARKIAQAKMPKLFLHARADEEIPIAHGRRLFELAQPPKQFHPLGGTHGTSHKVGASFFSAVRQFVAARGLPLTPR